MTPTPRLKKSETLEIRLPYPTKRAFMAACHERGGSASEALRQFIDAELAGPVAEPRLGRRAWRLIAGAAIATAMGAVALPTLAHPGLRAEFDRLDLNRDRAITAADLARLDANRDGRVTYDEFRAALPRR
ncbi:MAG TPA: EF-hand domain-containing protein [Phenylobacterium sp.]|jgi:hypothetical protein